MKKFMNNIVALVVVAAIPVGGFAATKKSKKNLKKVKKEAVAKTEEQKSPWGFSFITESTRNAATANESFEAASIFGLSYALDEKNLLQFVTYYTYMWDDINPAQGDISFRYTRTHDKLPGDIGFKTHYRLYMPTSDSSRTLGKYSGRVYGIFTGEINKTWSYSFVTVPTIMTYANDSSGQTSFVWQNEVGLSAKINDNLSFSTAIGHTHSETNDGLKSNPDISYYLLDNPFAFDDAMNFDLGLALSVDKFSLGATVSQTTNLRSSDSYSLFNDSETTYIIEFGVSI